MDVKLPHLGEGADSGTVVTVFVKEGDRIAKDQPLLELENEKAVATIPSTASGVVGKVFVKPGDKISVGQKLLSLATAGESPGPSPSQTPKSKPRPAEPEPAPSEPDGSEATELAVSAEKPQPEPAASPAIRKLARELGIDLSRVRGTARGGRIEMADVRAYIQRLQRPAAGSKGATAPATAKPAAERTDFSKWGAVTRKPLSPLRQVIARRMVENWNIIPHVTQFDEADVTALVALRKKYTAAYVKKGARLTLTSFVLETVAATLKQHPLFNSSLDEATQEIVFKDYCHIGIAVDTEAGLIVPVIRDVDRKSLLELSKGLEEVATKARERKVTADELKGGTFTISNQGGIGGAHFTPIINRPEVAILGLGRAALKAVVRHGKVEVRTMLPVALSYDHRVIDGGAAARFTVDFVKGMENFEEEKLEL